MRDNDEILAEVFDSLIQQGDGRISSEVGEMLNIGLRLYNECPDADPAFIERLGARLAREYAAQERQPLRTLRAAFLCAWQWARQPQVLLRALRSALLYVRRWLQLAPVHRALAWGALATALWLVALSVSPGLRVGVQAGLSRIITLLPGVEVVQQPEARLETTPQARRLGSYETIAQAARVAGLTPRTPSYLPAGLEFRSATVAEREGRQALMLYFAGDGGDAFTDPFAEEIELTIQEIDVGKGPDQPPLRLFVGAESVREVQVAGRPALWQSGEQNHAGGWLRSSGTLAVQDGDVVLLLWGGYSREEIIKVARSLLR